MLITLYTPTFLQKQIKNNNSGVNVSCVVKKSVLIIIFFNEIVFSLKQCQLFNAKFQVNSCFPMFQKVITPVWLQNLRENKTLKKAKTASKDHFFLLFFP